MAGAERYSDAERHLRHYLGGPGEARPRLAACCAMQWLSRTHERPRVALAFDDFPFTTDSARALLDVLDREGVRATLFTIGRKVGSRAELVRRAAAAGHSIQNHTFSHPRWREPTVEQVRSECLQCSEVIERVIGRRPLLLRWPGGRCSENVQQQAHRCGLICIDPIVTEIPDLGADPRRIRRLPRARAGAGQIIVFHDGPAATRRALPGIIADLHHHGAELVTAPELLGLEPLAGRGRQDSAAGREK
ncbi:MAG: polysaccharide deacetylase family protein [Armatimonadota bacterium]|nr:polysaccharide deacetylase family protein [Armatimonadota bacterium]